LFIRQPKSTPSGGPKPEAFPAADFEAAGKASVLNKFIQIAAP
jgi:hypothetical protein